MKLKLFKSKRAQLTMYIFSIMIMLMIIAVASIVAPFGAKFSTEMYAAGEDIILSANESLQLINDATVKSELSDSFASALATTQDNIDLNTAIFKHSWIIVLITISIVYFLWTRRDVQGNVGFV